jgi:hydrogenase maturation factor
MLSRDINTTIWKDFTPLAVILSLQEIVGVKIIHDVSEGGVKGSLLEIVTNNNFGLKVSSDNMKLYPGVERLQTDIFRAPSYGAFIIISDNIAVEEVEARCREQQFPCSIIGEVTSNVNLVFDDIIVREQNRTFLDEIYGSFDRKS